MARYSIGIDLGTTNCALAYVELTKKKADVVPWGVRQLVGPGEVAERGLLPSFLYLPRDQEMPAGSTALPWDRERSFIVGEWARSLGGQVPGQLVASAKSWLCHDGIDRTAAVLPWGAPAESARVSAVTASMHYLEHLAQSWDYWQAQEKTPARFAEQEITLTVPASFDDVARQLTATAAKRAGYEQVTLLEEPQAAFYAWIAQAERDRRRRQPLQEGMICLVADIGGGTSDFSLIECVAQEGALGFVRKAVGDHLLLGGDNMDLALAHRMEPKLGVGKLDAVRFAALTQACRNAKEALLGENAPRQHPVTIMGRGRAVVASSLSGTLTRQEVLEVICEGFFPLSELEEEPARARTGTGGLHDLGLPFVADAAISRHLASFLRQHDVTGENPPDAVLFNGGVFTPKLIRKRLVAVLKKWFDRPEREWEPIVLTTPSLDLAVAIGAAYYGRQRRVGGRRIQGGLARSYYIAVGSGSSQQMLCVVPQHLEEGESIELKEPVLELALGEPVQFPLYTSTVREKDKAGKMFEVEPLAPLSSCRRGEGKIRPQQLLKLAPLQTVLRGGKRSGTQGVPVTLSSTLTEIGTLEISLVAQKSPNRWKLEFNTREVVNHVNDMGADPIKDGEARPGQIELPKKSFLAQETFAEEKVGAALEAMQKTYATSQEDPARQLTKSWEKLLEKARRDWPSSLCRRLVDGLLEIVEERRRSPAHLSRWFHLTGYCLRPGYGDARDAFRVEQLWKALCGPGRVEATSGTSRHMDGGAEYWIMWRRVSGGLSPNLQRQLFDRLRPILVPGKGAAFKPTANELAEMWRTAGSLERLEPKLKEMMGEALVKQYRRAPVPPHVPWALARLGARAMLYAPLNFIVPMEVVARWLDCLLPYRPIHESDQRAWLWTLTTLSRKTGMRALDLDESLRGRVLEVLEREQAPRRFTELVKRGGELEREEQQQLFGDDLPLGLRLVGSE